MRVPLFRQLESNDCGPACIQMIAAYYKKKYSLSTIKSYCDMTRIGISLRDIIHCGKEIGFEIASVNVNIEEVHRMPLPAILYLRKGHYVVLEKIKKKKGGYSYNLVDPDYGRVKMQEEHLAEKWMSNGRGIAAVLAPAKNWSDAIIEVPEEKWTNRKMYKAIIDIIRNYKRNFLWIALLTLIVVMTNWAMPLLLKNTIDNGIMKKDINVVWTMLFGQFLFFLGFMFAGNISNLLTTKTSIKIDLKFISAYFDKIIRLPMKFFDIGLRTDLIQRLSDQSRISGFITGNLLSIVFAVLNVIVFSALLLIYNYEIFLIFISFSLVSFCYNSYFILKRKYIDYASFSVDSERNNAVHEMIMGMSEIKINNAQRARIAIWRRLEDKMNKLRIKLIYLDYYMSNGASLLSRLRDIVLTGLCALLVIQGSMTMGTMMMISFLLGQLAAPVNELISFAKNVQDAKLSCIRLNDIYEKPNETNDESINLCGIGISKGLKFVDASFKYAGISSPYVLQNISLEIPVGQITAIVGASGSGKTTLLKLMLGFYYPDKGDLLVDQNKMKDLNLDSWRDKCGVVMQDGRIFSGTVSENIAFAFEKPDFERLEYATQIACINERIKKLPMGYNTGIGETGIDLSGGEKQRIFIARAVYKNPDFVFFDEATSSLDANTERLIMENLRSFYKGRTAVIIAHRLSTVKHADNIVFMDSGRVMEQGTHEELLKLEGMYYGLVKNQLELEPK